MSLTSLTITYQQRSGFPVYQTWFANRTAAITGTATLDGAPIPRAIVRVTAPRGTVYTTTTDPDGTYAFPQLPVIANYRVEITPPDGAEGPDQPTRVSLAQAGSPGGVDQQADFAFTSPEDTVSVIGTVVDEDGRPVSNLEVVITDPDSGDVLVDTTTNSDGVYTGSDLPADTELDVSVADEPPVTITTGDDDAAPVVPDVIDAPAAVVATVAGVVSLDGASVPAGAVVELVDGTGAVVASTETDADGRYVFATAAGTYTVRTERPRAGGDRGDLEHRCDGRRRRACFVRPAVRLRSNRSRGHDRPARHGRRHERRARSGRRGRRGSDGHAVRRSRVGRHGRRRCVRPDRPGAHDRVRRLGRRRGGRGGDRRHPGVLGPRRRWRSWCGPRWVRLPLRRRHRRRVALLRRLRPAPLPDRARHRCRARATRGTVDRWRTRGRTSVRDSSPPGCWCCSVRRCWSTARVRNRRRTDHLQD
ncbi:carboxypeptidase-like regulatory domain-containing protein [Curtobacterium flaccumfaciens]|nr:carboxypeptidase-like regulatory domain-containing protein [Curtobacterium flaccumfaciens]